MVKDFLRLKEKRVTLLFALIAFTYVFYYAFYICDDSYFIIRTVDNFSRGYGLRHNILERVQAYTCPLWTFLMIPIYKVLMVEDLTQSIHRSWVVVLVLSYCVDVAVIFVFVFYSKNVLSFWVGFLLCLASQGFVQFLSSGLETPLSYLLLFLFFFKYFNFNFSTLTSRKFLEINIVACLICLNRLDLALVVFIPCLHLFLSYFKNNRKAAIGWLAISWLPLAVWTVFSLVYYGFPFPNTYYVKLGVNASRLTLLKMGLVYIFQCLRLDFLMIMVILASLFIALFIWKSKIARISVASSLLYLLYIISIGGDFLGYRFVAVSFVISIVVIVNFIQIYHSVDTIRYVIALLFLSIALSLNYDGSPLHGPKFKPTASGYPFYYNPSSITSLTNNTHSFPFSKFHHVNTDLPSLFSKSFDVLVTGGGLNAFARGPNCHAIEFQALSDPLLARLQTSKITVMFKPGHVSWKVPQEYVDSIRTGKNVFTQKALFDFYNDILIITRGDIFAIERLLTIVKLSFTKHKILTDSGVAFETEPCPIFK